MTTRASPPDRESVLALRAAGHHLDRPVDLLTAVGAIGVRDARGAAAVALHARVAGFSPDDLAGAQDRGDVVEVASARGVATLVPAGDVATFTLGTLPADEASLRHRLLPARPVLDAAGSTATDALARTVAAAREALAGGPLEVAALSRALTRALPELSPMCRGRCGVEHIDQGLFDLVGEAGTWQRLPADGTRVHVLLPEPTTDRADARRALVRRYLAVHGPSTVQDFADWCGIATADARASLAGDESGDIAGLADGSYLLAADLERLASPPEVQGLRLLPPWDPYLDGRDRATLVADPDRRKAIWRSPPHLGLVLLDGDAVATWNAKRTGKRLHLTVDPFPTTAHLLAAHHDALTTQAQPLAPLRKATTLDLHLA